MPPIVQKHAVRFGLIGDSKFTMDMNGCLVLYVSPVIAGTSSSAPATLKDDGWMDEPTSCFPRAPTLEAK